MFKKDDYIVLLKGKDDANYPINFVYKQREPYHYIQTYIDCLGDKNNGWAYYSFKKENSAGEWRFATLEEIVTYEQLGEPYNVTSGATLKRKFREGELIQYKSQGLTWDDASTNGKEARISHYTGIYDATYGYEFRDENETIMYECDVDVQAPILAKAIAEYPLGTEFNNGNIFNGISDNDMVSGTPFWHQKITIAVEVSNSKSKGTKYVIIYNDKGWADIIPKAKPVITKEDLLKHAIEQYPLGTNFDQPNATEYYELANVITDAQFQWTSEDQIVVRKTSKVSSALVYDRGVWGRVISKPAIAEPAKLTRLDLIDEAKRRGFGPLVKFIDLVHGEEFIASSTPFENAKKSPESHPSTMYLNVIHNTRGNKSARIYKNGVWASIALKVDDVFGFTPETPLDKWLRETKELKLDFDMLCSRLESTPQTPFEEVYQKLPGEFLVDKVDYLESLWGRTSADAGADYHNNMIDHWSPPVDKTFDKHMAAKRHKETLLNINHQDPLILKPKKRIKLTIV
jgi:hypothetical protein